MIEETVGEEALRENVTPEDLVSFFTRAVEIIGEGAMYVKLRKEVLGMDERKQQLDWVKGVLNAAFEGIWTGIGVNMR